MSPNAPSNRRSANPVNANATATAVPVLGAVVRGGKGLHPDVLEHAHHAELALLVDQRVVRDHRKVDVQPTPPGWR